MKIAETTAVTLADFVAEVEPQVERAKSLEDAAQTLAAAVHKKFEESVVLARVFLTVPFFSLPESNQQFVRQLADSVGTASNLKATTPVLSLLGTQGVEADWNDRRKSKDHLGIPLISAAFVDSIPMISRLLKELGVPMHWLDGQESASIEQIMNRSVGLFYIQNAAEAVDAQRRKIISAQNFVSSYKVQSVFGTGGAYTGGQIMVMVVFCRETFPRAVAERFLGLSILFKTKTRRLVGSGKIFAEDYVS